MPEFTAIKIEAYLDGAWADLTPDVLTSPAPHVSGMGIQGSSIMDRVGGIGTFTFSLKNSTASSGGVLGYYTPEGVNRRTGWGPGVFVRLYFEYEGFRRYRFYGKIDRDGIEAITGKYNERRVNVKCSNWMKDASTTLLDLAQYQTNITSVEGPEFGLISAAYLTLNNMTFQPNLVSYNGSSVVFETAFDNAKSNTTIIGELNKIIFSEMGLMYMRGSETSGENLVFERRTFRSDYYTANPSGSTIPKAAEDCTDELLLETGDLLLLETGTYNLLLEASISATLTDADIEVMTVHYGDNFYNQVKFKVYPRKVDASPVVLYNIESPIYVPNGQTLNDIRGDYRDPDNPDTKVNANNETMIAPVATTDYLAFANEDGTGTNHTANVTITAEYGTADVKYTIVNGAGADVYITFLQARGYGIYFYDATEKLFNDEAAQTEGIVKLEIDLPYLDRLSQILDLYTTEADIWTELLNGVSNIEMSIPRISFTANKSTKLMMLFMFLEPSWLVNVSETVTTPGAGGQAYYSSPWFVQGYDFDIINGSDVVVNYELKWNGRT